MASSTSANARTQALLYSYNQPPRAVDYPKNTAGVQLRGSELFGKHVFNLDTLEKTLPKPIFRKFNEQRAGSGPGLDKPTADAIAHAVRVWAQEK